MTSPGVGETGSGAGAPADRRLLVLLVLAPVLGLLGVVAAEVVPDGRIGYHLVRAVDAELIDATSYSASPLGTTIDHASECVALSIGLGDRPGRNVVSSALTSPSYGRCQNLVAQLEIFEATDTLPPGYEYLRYWHGYTVVTRPAVGIFGVGGARWIAFGLLACSIVGMAAAVGRRFGRVAVALLVAPALATTDMIVGGLSMQQSLGMATAWAGGWAALAVVSRRPNWRTAALVGALAGALNAYLDLMTTIPGAMALTAIGATMAVWGAGGDSARRSAWRVTAAAVAGWSIGLAWMWSAKWALAALVVGVDDVVDNVRRTIEFRLSGQFEDISPTRTQGLTDALRTWWGQPLTPWVIAVMIAIVVAIIVRRRPAPWTSIAASCAIVAAPVVAVYLALNNHTQIHAYLVYRSLPLAFGGLGAFVVAASTAAPVGTRAVVPAAAEPSEA